MDPAHLTQPDDDEPDCDEEHRHLERAAKAVARLGSVFHTDPRAKDICGEETTEPAVATTAPILSRPVNTRPIAKIPKPTGIKGKTVSSPAIATAAPALVTQEPTIGCVTLRAVRTSPIESSMIDVPCTASATSQGTASLTDVGAAPQKIKNANDPRRRDHPPIRYLLIR